MILGETRQKILTLILWTLVCSSKFIFSQVTHDEPTYLFDEDEEAEKEEEIRREEERQASLRDEPSQNEDEHSEESVYKPITIKSTDKIYEIRQPDEDKIRELFDLALTEEEEFYNQLDKYVVGISGQNRLMTLGDSYKTKLIRSDEAAAILDAVDHFEEGEIAAIKLMFGLRSGQEIVIGRYPPQLIARPVGNEAFHPNDPSLGPMTKWLEIMGNMVWTNPTGAGSGVYINTDNGFAHDFQLTTLSANIHGNYFSERRNRSFNGGAGINPQALSGSMGWAGPDAMGSMWFSIMSGWAGAGYSGKFNIEENQLGLSAVGAGAWLGGWKDYVQAGASISVITSDSSQVGLGGVISLSKDRITSYKGSYQGEYDRLMNNFIREYKKRVHSLKDERKVTKYLQKLLHHLDKGGQREAYLKQDIDRINGEIKFLQEQMAQFAEEKKYLQGKHFVEVVDSQSKGLRLQGGFYTGVVNSGFRAGASFGKQSIHRFYTDLERAQELLADGNGEKIALLRIPEEFDTEKFPDLMRPHLWKTGEEVITTMQRTFYGSIVIGVGDIPGLESKIGMSASVSGTFEFGVRKLPGNKIEVTFKPSEIKEMGAFVSTISNFGPQLTAASSVALAMRQTFVFDLDNEKARDTYSLFLTGGVMPIEFSMNADVVGQREAENLLDVAIIAKKNLAKKGILLTYLEKIDVPAKKFYMGVGRSLLVSTQTWAGLSYEYLQGKGKVISTNAEFALSRTSSFEHQSFGNLASGYENREAYATVKRSFTKEKLSQDEIERLSDNGQKETPKYVEDGYTWRFRGLTIRATLEDTKVTGNEQNEMVKILNTKFLANIYNFPETSEIKAHKQNREIMVEREISPQDLDQFNSIRQSTIKTAARGSGIGVDVLNALVADLELKGHDQMADVILEFINKHGLKGVSAIHLLLDGNCRNLYIRTTSDAYTKPINDANHLEATYTDASIEDLDSRQILDLKYDTPEKTVRAMYKKIRQTIHDIDQGLQDLLYDPLLEGQDDLNKFGDTHLREKKAGLRSKLLAAKNRLIELLDLEKQEFSDNVQLTTYKKLQAKDLDVFQRYFVLHKKYAEPISINDPRKQIGRRWTTVKHLLDDIDQEIASFLQPDRKKVLGEVFVEKQLIKLEDLKINARALIDIKHLAGQIDPFIKKMRKNKMGFLPAKPIYHEIAGHVESLRTRKDPR